MLKFLLNMDEGGNVYAELRRDRRYYISIVLTCELAIDTAIVLLSMHLYT
jgi:hypothetical protein